MPTPIAPPSTPSAVRSMPAADSANIRPTNSNTARIAFAAILRTLILPRLPLSRRASSSDDSQSAPTSTSTALTAPSRMLRTLIWVAPIFHWMASSSCNMTGSTPVTHNTTASHTTQDRLRSMTRTRGERGKLARSTRTVSRMTASDMKIGSASLNTASGTTFCNAQRASSTSSSTNSGKKMPSTTPLPNHIEPRLGSGPRTRRTTNQATARQPAMTPSSISAVGCSSACSSRPRSSVLNSAAIRRRRPAPAGVQPRCAPGR